MAYLPTCSKIKEITVLQQKGQFLSKEKKCFEDFEIAYTDPNDANEIHTGFLRNNKVISSYSKEIDCFDKNYKKTILVENNFLITKNSQKMVSLQNIQHKESKKMKLGLNLNIFLNLNQRFPNVTYPMQIKKIEIQNNFTSLLNISIEKDQIELHDNNVGDIERLNIFGDINLLVRDFILILIVLLSVLLIICCVKILCKYFCTLCLFNLSSICSRLTAYFCTRLCNMIHYKEANQAEKDTNNDDF